MSDQGFMAVLMGLEPHLAGDAKRFLQSLRGIQECFPGQSLPEIEKTVRALKAIMAHFPGQSASDAEKSLRTLIQSSRTSGPILVQRAKTLVAGQSDETADQFLGDVKKLKTTELSSLARALGFELSGAKDKMLHDLRQWLDSRGRIVPVSAKEQDIADGKTRAMPLRDLIQSITPERAGEILAATDAAYKALKLDGFRAFGETLGITVTGTKAAMQKQIKDSVRKLSVSHVQTRF